MFGVPTPVKKTHQIDGVQLAKTRLCSFYQEGRCKYGDECTYAHSFIEVRKAPEELRKTKMCELFPSGQCFDLDCNFAHVVNELRSKKDARRKARSSLKHDQKYDVAEPVITNEAFALMKQIASLLSRPTQASTPPPAVYTPTGPSFSYTTGLGLFDCPASTDDDVQPSYDIFRGLADLVGDTPLSGQSQCSSSIKDIGPRPFSLF